MNTNIHIRNSADVCYIDIEGTIGVPEAWQFTDPESHVATYEGFRETVKRIGAIRASEVVVSIRSTGGDVNDALLIYDALRQLDVPITTRCYGYTASAATLIAQAASEGRREISTNALYLIHNAVCAAEGNAEEFASKAELLRKTDARLAEVYAVRAGRPAEEFAGLMAENNGNGRWLTPAECVAAGLADVVIDAAGEHAAMPRNLATRWRRMLSRFGLAKPDAAPAADANILHFGEDPDETPLRQSILAAQDAQQRAEPTRTVEVEDPSSGDPVRSANRRAYDEDVRHFRSRHTAV